MLEHLISVTLPNFLNVNMNNNIINGLMWLTQHYNDLLTIIRWTVPCIITFSLLLCFMISDKKVTE